MKALELIRSFRSKAKEDTLFSIVAFATFFVPTLFSLYAYENYEAMKLPLFTILMAWGLMVFVRTRTALPMPKLFLVLLGGWWLWAGLSTLASSDKLASLIGFYPRLNGSLLLYTDLALYALFLAVTLTRERMRFLANMLIAASSVIAVFGIMQTHGIAFYEGLEAEILRPQRRVPSTLGNPNFSAMFIASVMPFALVLLFAARKQWQRVLYIIASFVMLWAMAVFTSRGALIALFLGVGVLGFAFLLQKRFRLVLVLIGFSAAALLVSNVFFSLGRPNTIGRTVELTDTTVLTRFFLWDETVGIIKKYPLFGIGLGNFQNAYERIVADNAYALSAGWFDDAHNLFLHMAAIGGTPLTLFFLACIGYAMWVGTKEWWRTKDPVLAATLAGLIGYLFSASFTPVPIPCLILLMLLLVYLVQHTSTEVSFAFPSFVKRGMLAAGVLCIVYGVAFITSEHLFYAGLKAYFHQDPARTYRFETWAVRVNPFNHFAWVYRGASAAKSGVNPEIASGIIDHALSLHPETARSYHQAGASYWQLYVRTENRAYAQRAADLLKVSIAFNPNIPERYGELAFYYHKAGNPEKALVFARKAAILDPGNIAAWIMLSRMYQDLGMQAQTKYAMHQAFEIDPNNMQVRRMWYQAKNIADVRQINLQVMQAENYLE